MGINFTKLHVERKSGPKGKINVSNNVAISDIEEVKLGFSGKTQKSLKFMFKFTSKYEPEVGIIDLEGDLIYLTEDKKAEELLAQWKKNKKLDPELMTILLNNILNKCNIEALILSKEMGLPAPIPLPKINKPKADEKKK